MTESSFPVTELEEADTLLQELLRIDTSNPPGGEKEATDRVARFCRDLGLSPEICGADPERPNLVARWNADPSHRKHRPLVLSCHLDVVPAAAEQWTHDPFSGHHDGTFIWGRGAIDMKGFAVMALAALARLRQENLPLTRDVIFAAVCDEEAGTRLGSRWLVENRPDLLGDKPEYVINEVGGFSVHLKGRRFYPIQVAEKGVAWLRLTISGQSGHSSLPARDTAVERLGRAVTSITRTQLPWHPSEEAIRFIRGFAAPDSWVARKVAPLIAHPTIGPRLLPLVVPSGSRRLSLEAILRNTANPTCLVSDPALNVMPEEVSVDIDGRLAIGQTAEDLIRELEDVLPRDLRSHLDWEILHEAPASSFSTDTELFRELKAGIQRSDPEGHIVPSIIPGFTDSQNYAKLGAQCYGFYPVQLPEDLDFASLFHGVDERIPVEGFHWGIQTLTETLRRFLVR